MEFWLGRAGSGARFGFGLASFGLIWLWFGFGLAWFGFIWLDLARVWLDLA